MPGTTQDQSPYSGDEKALAAVIGIAEEDISIKATTNERLGYIGRGEGAAAYAVALIETT